MAATLSDSMSPAEYLTAIVCAAMALVGLSAYALAPRPGQPVAVIIAFADARQTADIVARAGGTLVAVGNIAGLVIAAGDDFRFVSRLYAAGAMLVLDGRAAPWCRRPVPVLAGAR